jgi:hypothetical protein
MTDPSTPFSAIRSPEAQAERFKRHRAAALESSSKARQKRAPLKDACLTPEARQRRAEHSAAGAEKAEQRRNGKHLQRAKPQPEHSGPETQPSQRLVDAGPSTPEEAPVDPGDGQDVVPA